MRIIRVFPVATMKPGDTYILNDPYCGGTHLPDVAVVMPVVKFVIVRVAVPIHATTLAGSVAVIQLQRSLPRRDYYLPSARRSRRTSR